MAGFIVIVHPRLLCRSYLLMPTWMIAKTKEMGLLEMLSFYGLVVCNASSKGMFVVIGDFDDEAAYAWTFF